MKKIITLKNEFQAKRFENIISKAQYFQQWELVGCKLTHRNKNLIISIDDEVELARAHLNGCVSSTIDFIEDNMQLINQEEELVTHINNNFRR